jgi:hypothetical protein
VSINHPYKDYVALQDRYAALGTHELVVFDPLLAGPQSLGGPVPLQLWRRDASRAFERIHFGDAPVYSEVLDAWVIADGRSLSIADDRAGTRRWLNEAQQNHLEAERHRAEAERNRVEAERLRTASGAMERELELLRARLRDG